VAAVAHLRGAPVLTSDVHFERIKRTALPGLEVIDARAA